MAKAKKLPSGSWRVLVYDYTDESGKRHYQSFTSDDPSAKGKREAEYAAAEYARTKEREGRKLDLNVKQAVTRYIALKEPVLSPSTTTAYRSIARTHLEAIADISIQAIDNKTLQRWIGDLSQTHTPKTVRNIYGLVVSSIIQFSPGAVFSVRLPAKEKPELYIPTDADIQKLLQHIKGKEIEIAVYLAAFGPMRRGEICAVTSEDVKGNFVTVNKSMVHNPDKTWSIKQPKTYAGFREIEYPQFVIDRIQGIEGRLVKGTPDQIINRVNSLF